MSRILKYYFPVLFLALITACTEDVLLTGDLKVSEIETKTDYLAPIALEKDLKEDVWINGEKIEFVQGVYALENAGFYEMMIGNSDPILFVLLDKERGGSEWGLKKWIPKEPLIQDNFNGEIEIIHPKNYWTNIAMPFVFRINGWTATEIINLSCTINGSNEFLMKNGVGTTSSPMITDEIQFSISNQTHSKTLQKFDAIDMVLNGTIDEHLTINPNTLVHVTNDISINEMASLTIMEGCILMINEGVNITNFGSIQFSGTATNPILVTCSETNKYFGGFISEGSSATITANNTFFTNFSFHSSSEYQYGHAKHQALFKSKATVLTFNNCYFLDTPGQVFYPENCELSITNCIVQRAKTSGQINGSTLIIDNSYFSDFPDDSQNYLDQDNDAIYLSGSDAIISNSMFLYAKDDGIDSGGGEGGVITLDNCKIEACFHEGMALSSNAPAVKLHSIKNSFIYNCQQGVELGYSSPEHTVIIDNCSIKNNYIGVRYGDNYEWNINGKITIDNSIIQENTKNIWNMVHQTWAPKDENIIINNSTVD